MFRSVSILPKLPWLDWFTEPAVDSRVRNAVVFRRASVKIIEKLPGSRQRKGQVCPSVSNLYAFSPSLCGGNDTVVTARLRAVYGREFRSSRIVLWSAVVETKIQLRRKRRAHSEYGSA